MSETVAEHHQHAPQTLVCAVLTVSDTRTPATDKGGDTLVELLTAAGHSVAQRALLPDEPDALRVQLAQWQDEPAIDAILLTGGTGISRRDQTYETIAALLTKPLPGYGELFRLLSYQEIGPAAMLSRAVGGLYGDKLLFTMPGSPAAIRLALEKLLLPELGHLVREARK